MTIDEIKELYKMIAERDDSIGDLISKIAEKDARIAELEKDREDARTMYDDYNEKISRSAAIGWSDLLGGFVEVIWLI